MSQARQDPFLLSLEDACSLKAAEGAVHWFARCCLNSKLVSKTLIFDLDLIYLFFGWREPREEKEGRDSVAKQKARHPDC